MRNHAKRQRVQRHLASTLTLALCLGGLHFGAGAAEPSHQTAKHQASTTPCRPLTATASEPAKATRTRQAPAQGQTRPGNTGAQPADTEREPWRST